MPLNHSKIVTLPRLLEKIHEPRVAGKKLVFTNGCFDILHPGHVDLLARCKTYGDFLILGLNSDASVRRQNKGPERPLNTFAARAFVLAHLESVDFIVEFDQNTPADLSAAVRPDVLIKGGDWPVDKIVGHELVLADGGKVLSLPLLEGWSTTALVNKIRR